MDSSERSPRPLVGRERELQAVHAALADPAVRAVVVRGAGGIGKTALFCAVLDEARAAGALTGRGKCREGRSGRDLEPLMLAIEAAVTAALEQLYDPEGGRRDLLRLLGDKAEAFGGIAEGRSADSAGTSASPLTAAGADAQVAEAMLQVLHWLQGFGAPVLLLIDDWGRAGAQTQRMVQRIVAARGLSAVRLLATERPEEAFGAELDGQVERLDLGPLRSSARLELARLHLGDRAGAAADVLAFLGGAAARPFDLVESIRVLTDAGVVALRAGAWRLDVARATPALAGAAARSVVRRTLDSHPHARTLARLLAVHGDGAELDDLARAADLSSADAGAAFSALRERGLLQGAPGRLGFAHDRLRAEVLVELGEAARRQLAGKLATALRERGVEPGRDERGMSLLWLRLEAGIDQIRESWWRDAFALGALRARQVGDRAAAERFVEAALDLASRGAGYTYPLLAEAAFDAVTRGDDAAARQWADYMEAYAADPVQRAAAREMRVFARRASGDLAAALEVARQILADTGATLPRRASPLNLAMAAMRIFSLNPARARRALDPTALALEAPMIRAINGIGSLLFEHDPRLVVLLVTRALPARIVYGTAAGAATFALMCCAFGAYRRAAAWADAADRLQGPEQPLRAVAKQYATNFGHVFVRPRPVTCTRGDEMTALAYAGGDVAVAAYGNRDKVLDALFGEAPLEETAVVADEAIRVAERLGDAATIPHVRALRQLIEQLQAGGPEAWRLDGVHFSLASQRQVLQDNGLANTGRGVAALEALLGVLFGRYGEVALLADRPWPRFGAAPFQAQTQIWAFATALAAFRTGRRASRFALWNLRRLGRLNPNDFLHRIALLDAEAARRKRRRGRALATYAAAVSAASSSGCRLEYGLVAAVAAEGAESLGAPHEARLWRETAARAWRALGADGLVAQRFGRALRPEGADAAELTAARDAAERADRAKSRLLAAVGHELRTPLQGALGLVELAEAGDGQLDVGELRQVIRHLAGVVGDLTDLGALEGELAPIRPQAVDVRALARAVAALHAPEARRVGRRLAAPDEDEPLWVEADEQRLRQVLGNLVANALRHGEGAVEVGVEAADGRLRFWVRDEGPPLGPSELRRIFEPFDRGGRAADQSGLGVGLFLGRRLAQRMGGDLAVRPLLEGKVFELDIPAAASPAPRAAAGALKGLRVLLAEDVELSRRVLAGLLRAEGCAVVEAADGDAALAAAELAAFDLALLDQRMPGRTGLEVAERLRGRHAPVRVVLMSADLDAPLQAAADALDIERVLQKPVGIAELRGLAGAAQAQIETAEAARADELRARLGPSANALLAAVRPALEQELAQLAADLQAEQGAAADAQLHRIRGLSAHFGLRPLSAVLSGAQAADPELLQRLRTAMAEVDWDALCA